MTAPDWAARLIRDSGAPATIIGRLADNRELAPLWDRLREIDDFDEVRFVASLPLLTGLFQGGINPWFKMTAREQTAHAKRVARLARELNVALASLWPLEPFRLHQVFPQRDNEAHWFLAGLPPIASTRADDSTLLSIIARRAEKVAKMPRRTETRPKAKDAKERALVRTFAGAFGEGQNSPIAHAFLAELVNAIGNPSEPWTADRVRKSLKASALSRSRKST